MRDAEEEFRAAVREELADGIDHVTERERHAERRDRADTDGWRRDSASDPREGSGADADETPARADPDRARRSDLESHRIDSRSVSNA